MIVRLLWWALAVFSALYVAVIVWALQHEMGDAASLVWTLIFVPSLMLSGAILFWKRPDNRTAHLLVGATLAMFVIPAMVEVPTLIAFEENGLQDWMWASVWVNNTLTMGGFVLLSILIALLPDGRVRYPREKWLTRISWIVVAFPTLALISNDFVLTYEEAFTGLPAVPYPYAVPALAPYGEAIYAVGNGLGALVFGAALVLQVMRYRAAPIRERKQVRWVIFATALSIFLVTLGSLLRSVGVVPSGHNLVTGLFTIIPGLLLFASIVVAVLEPRWVDVDIVIRKSFVYGVLSALILLLYVGVASAFGVAAGARLNVELAIVLTVVVALLFQPARHRLQVVADRWVFGERPTKYEAVAEFGETIEQAADPTELLPQLVETIQKAIGLEWVGAKLDDGTSAEIGTVTGEPEHVVAIGSPDEEIGEIRCGPKPKGSMDADEVQLVNTLAGQVGLAVMNARLAGRIVNAAEAERRRIERNIHDGAQQELVALVARLGMARSAATERKLSADEIDDLQREAQQILGDLRELAQGIHPSVLSDGGILEAVEERCSHLPLDVTVDSSPNLRTARYHDDIEGAAYFFVTESLTNVLKHADAASATVSLRADNGNLVLSVSDDGHGFDAETAPLNGLAGLRDRVRALGGTVSISSRPGSGTLVSASLPIQ